MNRTTRIAQALLISCCSLAVIQAQQPTTQERVAALKANLAASHAALRSYQWTETTAVSLKGEVKSTTVDQCSYGPDGKVQKIVISAPAPSDKRGIRGRIVENKKEEMSAYMKQAVALVKEYVPPTEARIEACRVAGNMSAAPMGGTVTLTFTNYLKAGDSLSVKVDMKTNTILGLSVNTYIDTPSEGVTLVVTFSKLDNGTTYAATSTLDAKAKQLQVVIQNSNYSKIAS